jgi:uncharacterized membrane protein
MHKKYQMHKDLKTKKEVVRVNGKLKEVVTYHDEKGNVVHRKLSSLKVEFHPRDMLQVIVGAAILAVPVGFTEETWRMGESLPWLNVFGLMFISLLFIATFVYYNYHTENIRINKKGFLMRVVFTYIFAFLVVSTLLGLIQRTPWSTDWALALKRIVIVTFPSSMSAAVADTIK